MFKRMFGKEGKKRKEINFCHIIYFHLVEKNYIS